MLDNASALVASNLADADHLESLPNTSATQAVDSTEHHPDPTALGLNATAWVSLAMIVVIVLLLVKKVPAVIGGSLDKKIAVIRAQLDEAASLRAEAEALKADAEAKARAAAAESEALLVHAREEAESIVSTARTDAALLIERHGKMAEDKIAAAERAAIAEVRAKTVAIATAAAEKMILEGHDASLDEIVVTRAIKALSTVRIN